jgi:type IV secretory pathway VirB2 component (pilin)
MSIKNLLTQWALACKKYLFSSDVLATLGVVFLLLLLVQADPAMAQATTGSADEGATFLLKIKNLLYGPAGLIVAILLLGWGIYEWFNQGFKTAVGIFALVIVFFVIPAIGKWAQMFGMAQSA